MPGQLSTQKLTILILALMSTGMSQSLVIAILGPLGREVQLGELQITSIIAASALVFSVAAPRWGRLSDRVGRKPIILAGLLGYTAGTLVFASVFYAGLTGLLSGTVLYVVLISSRCSQAAIMSATSPASTAYAADHSSREQRTKTMARLGTANSMGVILGPAVSGALATFGLLAPLYFAAALAALAALLVWRRLPGTPRNELIQRGSTTARLRYRDPRFRVFLGSSIGLYVGFSGIQQTLAFQVQDKLALSGIETAQMTGAALMISAVMNFLMQMTAMQWLKLETTQFIKLGLVSLLSGAAVIAAADTFLVLAAGMAFVGAGLGLCMPAISAGVSLAVDPEEQGAAAGLVSSCPALGFIVGPLCAGALYQVHDSLAPLFSAVVFFGVLVALVLSRR